MSHLWTNQKDWFNHNVVYQCLRSITWMVIPEIAAFDESQVYKDQFLQKRSDFYIFKKLQNNQKCPKLLFWLTALSRWTINIHHIHVRLLHVNLSSRWYLLSEIMAKGGIALQQPSGFRRTSNQAGGLYSVNGAMAMSRDTELNPQVIYRNFAFSPAFTHDDIYFNNHNSKSWQ